MAPCSRYRCPAWEIHTRLSPSDSTCTKIFFSPSYIFRYFNMYIHTYYYLNMRNNIVQINDSPRIVPISFRSIRPGSGDGDVESRPTSPTAELLLGFYLVIKCMLYYSKPIAVFLSFSISIFQMIRDRDGCTNNNLKLRNVAGEMTCSSRNYTSKATITTHLRAVNMRHYSSHIKQARLDRQNHVQSLCLLSTRITSQSATIKPASFITTDEQLQ